MWSKEAAFSAAAKSRWLRHFRRGCSSSEACANAQLGPERDKGDGTGKVKNHKNVFKCFKLETGVFGEEWVVLDVDTAAVAVVPVEMREILRSAVLAAENRLRITRLAAAPAPVKECLRPPSSWERRCRLRVSVWEIKLN